MMPEIEGHGANPGQVLFIVQGVSFPADPGKLLDIGLPVGNGLLGIARQPATADKLERLFIVELSQEHLSQCSSQNRQRSSRRRG